MNRIPANKLQYNYHRRLRGQLSWRLFRTWLDMTEGIHPPVSVVPGIL